MPVCDLHLSGSYDRGSRCSTGLRGDVPLAIRSPRRSSPVLRPSVTQELRAVVLRERRTSAMASRVPSPTNPLRGCRLPRRTERRRPTRVESGASASPSSPAIDATNRRRIRSRRRASRHVRQHPYSRGRSLPGLAARRGPEANDPSARCLPARLRSCAHLRPATTSVGMVAVYQRDQPALVVSVGASSLATQDRPKKGRRQRKARGCPHRAAYDAPVRASLRA